MTGQTEQTKLTEKPKIIYNRGIIIPSGNMTLDERINQLIRLGFSLDLYSFREDERYRGELIARFKNGGLETARGPSPYENCSWSYDLFVKLVGEKRANGLIVPDSNREPFSINSEDHFLVDPQNHCFFSILAMPSRSYLKYMKE